MQDEIPDSTTKANHSLLLRRSKVKKFFTNHEREIAWRAANDAYKWGSWKLRHGYDPSIGENLLCRFCKRHEDSFNHVFDQCSIIKEVLIETNSIVNEMCQDHHIFNLELVLFNDVGNESQFQKLIPLKAANIVKTSIIQWHTKLYANSGGITDPALWVRNITDEINLLQAGLC